MGQRKGPSWGVARKRMIVLPLLRVTLSSQSGVAHNHRNPVGDPKSHAARWQRPFIDPYLAGMVVGDAGGVGTSCLALSGKGGKDSALLLAAEVVSVVDHSK
jgi:hypothetical protein